MRKLVTNRWVHVHPDIVSRGVMEEVTVLLELLFVCSSLPFCYWLTIIFSSSINIKRRNFNETKALHKVRGHSYCFICFKKVEGWLCGKQSDFLEFSGQECI